MEQQYARPADPVAVEQARALCALSGEHRSEEMALVAWR